MTSSTTTLDTVDPAPRAPGRRAAKRDTRKQGGSLAAGHRRLFAPFVPFVTDEVWSWWHAESVHAAAWPSEEPATWPCADNDAVLAVASEVLAAIRHAKSDAKVSMKAPVESVTVTETPDRAAALEAAAGDVREAGAVGEVRIIHAVSDDGDASSAIDVVLAPDA